MAWLIDAPTLPTGVSYGSSKTVSANGNAFNWTCKFAVARLDENKVSIRAKIKGDYGQNGYNSYYPPPRHYLKCSGVESFPTWSMNTTTRYLVITLEKGSSVTVTAGYSSDASTGKGTKSTTMTGPEYVTTYPVTYDGNGATSGSTAAQSKLYGTDITVASNGFFRAGYTFSRWNTKADGTGTNYSPGAVYATEAPLTLYAIWSINTYTVSFNANGGSGTTASQTKTYGVNLTLRPNGFTFTGHAFSHWNTKPDDTGVSYADEAVYSTNAAATLYAIWDGTWGVTYEGNGATGGSTAPQTKVEDVSLTLSANGFTREKYSFVEWNTEPDGSGTSYDPGDLYTENAALVLYAQWVKNNIPVYYNDNGTIRQVERAFYNDNGTIRECSIYYNDNGTIRAVI